MSDTPCGCELDAVGVSFDRDHELGEVAVADDPPELLLGYEHAGNSVASSAWADRRIGAV